MLKKNNYLFMWSLATIVALSIIPMWVMPSMAQVTFRPPAGDAPKTSSGGASRDGSSCGLASKSNKGTPITPLMPTANIGLTMAERPTIMVYLPATSAKKAFFSIQDEDTNQHYQTTLYLPQEAGVMEVSLPDSAPALKTGKNYKWSLVMICSEDLEPDSPSVSGWIRRVQGYRALTASLESVSQLAKDGVWYDSLSTLAKLRRSQPNDQNLTASWQQLLNSAGLEAIAQEPLVN
jgi:Domain of Unknown Function (DUF928)